MAASLKSSGDGDQAMNRALQRGPPRGWRQRPQLLEMLLQKWKPFLRSVDPLGYQSPGHESTPDE